MVELHTPRLIRVRHPTINTRPFLQLQKVSAYLPAIFLMVFDATSYVLLPVGTVVFPGMLTLSLNLKGIEPPLKITTTRGAKTILRVQPLHLRGMFGGFRPGTPALIRTRSTSLEWNVILTTFVAAWHDGIEPPRSGFGDRAATIAVCHRITFPNP